MRLELPDVLMIQEGLVWRGRKGSFLQLEIPAEILSILRAHSGVRINLEPDWMHGPWLEVVDQDTPSDAGNWFVLSMELVEMMREHPETIAFLPFAIATLEKSSNSIRGWNSPPLPGWFPIGKVGDLRRN